MKTRLVSLLLASLALPLPVQPQAVRGLVRDAQSERAIESGVVTLVDAGGSSIRAVLTDSLGHFALLAPQPGAYRLRFERLGYVPTTTDRFTLQPGETITRTIRATAVTISLAQIVVRDTPRCRVLKDADTLTARVWTSVRSVLASAAAGEMGVYPHVTIERYERDFDQRVNAVTRERKWTSTGASASPFVALPTESLVRDGFVQRRADSTYFYAPEARTLIAEEFLQTHCFRVNDERRERGRVGLDIEPVPGRRVADINGTLWLDAESGELRRLDFIFVNLPPTVPFGTSNGWVEFRRLPNGAWIVDRWALRLPLVAQRQRQAAYGPPVPGQEVLPSAAGYELAGVHEEGGRVVSMEKADARAGRRPAVTTSVRGRISTPAGDPVAGARAFLSGSSHSSLTDAAGDFSLEDVPLGRYRLSFTHARLDTLGIVADAVDIDASQAAFHALRMPTDEQIVRAACGGVSADAPATLLYGFVLDESAAQPAPASKVLISWRTAAPSGSVVARRPTTVEVESDTDGRYQVCGVPLDEAVDVVAIRDGQRGTATRLGPGSAPVRRADVTVPRQRQGRR